MKYFDGYTENVEIVDTGNLGSGFSFALDGTDRPHISYYDIDNGDLKYSWSEGSGPQVWNKTVVAGAGDEGDAGIFSSIALDNEGKPYISLSTPIRRA